MHLTLSKTNFRLDSSPSVHHSVSQSITPLLSTSTTITTIIIMDSQGTESRRPQATQKILLLTASIALLSSGIAIGFASSLHLLQLGQQQSSRLVARLMTLASLQPLLDQIINSTSQQETFIGNLRPVLGQILNSTSLQEAFMGDLLEEMLETEERVKKTLIRAVGESFGQFSIQLKEDQSNWNKKVLANLAQSISSVQTQLETGHSRDKEELIRALRQQLDAYNESKKNFSKGQETLLAKATTNCRELIERNKEVVVASLN